MSGYCRPGPLVNGWHCLNTNGTPRVPGPRATPVGILGTLPMMPFALHLVFRLSLLLGYGRSEPDGGSGRTVADASGSDPNPSDPRAAGPLAAGGTRAGDTPADRLVTMRTPPILNVLGSSTHLTEMMSW